MSEAFERVLGAISRGSGPRDSFRPYLLTTVRRTAYDRARRERRTGPTADEWILDQGVEDPDPSLAAFERQTMIQAFESLPERWQTVLWHTEIEETPPEDLAVMMGVRPNALAALAYRAREGLRQAYVLAHVDIDLREPLADCRWTIERLPKYLRGRLSDDAGLKLEHHLDDCDDCRGFYFEMADVGVSLRAVMVPLVFGGPAVLAAAQAISATGVVGGAGVASIAGTISVGGAASSGAAAGTVAASVAVATVAATVGGALVLPAATTVREPSLPAPIVVAYGRTIPGLLEPVVLAAPAAPSGAVMSPGPDGDDADTAESVGEVAAAPALVIEADPAPDATARQPNADGDEPDVTDVPGEREPSGRNADGKNRDGDLGDDLVGDIGSPLVITPPVPDNPVVPVEADTGTTVPSEDPADPPTTDPPTTDLPPEDLPTDQTGGGEKPPAGSEPTGHEVAPTTTAPVAPTTTEPVGDLQAPPAAGNPALVIERDWVLRPPS